MRPQKSMPTLSLPPDVVGAIFQFLKPAHVLDAASTAKAWAEASDSKLVWADQVARAVDTAVRDTLAVGGASTHDAKADAAVRNALERCQLKARIWAAKNPALASAKARAWYAIGVALPPITAAVVAKDLQRSPGVIELLVAGGGCRNQALMHELRRRCKGIWLRPLDAIGIDPQHREAMAFALLAWWRVTQWPAADPAVTGARRGGHLGVAINP